MSLTLEIQVTDVHSLKSGKLNEAQVSFRGQGYIDAMHKLLTTNKNLNHFLEKTTLLILYNLPLSLKRITSFTRK